MTKHLRILVICIFLFNPFYSGFFIAGAAPLFLADKHKIAAIACGGCHKENPPKDQVPTVICNECHGGQARLANRTQKVIPNPHESHLGDVKCELCHHVHKSSENYCGNCHEFGYKVP